MLPSNPVELNVKNGVATIGAKADRASALMIIGASMRVSGHRSKWSNTFSLELGEGENRGVIAVVAMSAKTMSQAAMFIGVTKDGDKIDVRTTVNFVPDPGRLGQIYNDGRMEVVVGEAIYTNTYPGKFDVVHSEYKLVDADSLCKYMVSIIDKEDLEKASTGYVKSLSLAEQIETYKEDTTRLDSKLLEEESQNGELKVRIAELAEEKQHLIEKTVDLEEELRIHKDAAHSLNEATSGKKWFVRMGLVHNFFYAIAYGEYRNKK